MTIRILREAAAELRDAIARYEDIDSGLGIRLKQEVVSALDWIGAHPEALRLRPNGCRRFNLKVFPYYVAYMIRHDTIWILAIPHAARMPEYWIRRRPPPDRP